jgi:ATP-dependent Clp protease ATP-binding subunit ClpB
VSDEVFRIEDFGVDLCALARAGRLDPVAGRRCLIARIAQVLARKSKRNPLLLGEPGVGKSALVEGLAQLMVSDEAPLHLRGLRIFSLHLGSIVAGTAYRGDFEQRLRGLIGELSRPGSGRILFVDEIHLLDRAGRSEGGLDAANLLKPLLARGALACIGATTSDEWACMAARDPALARRFLPIPVPEPSLAEALEMLRALRPRLEQHHGVEIPDEALEWAMAPSSSATGRLPDRAIDRLDGACACLRLRAGTAALPEEALALASLKSALHRFDLGEVARLRHRVLPGLRRECALKLDTQSLQMQDADQGGDDGDKGGGE